MRLESGTVFSAIVVVTDEVVVSITADCRLFLVRARVKGFSNFIKSESKDTEIFG